MGGKQADEAGAWISPQQASASKMPGCAWKGVRPGWSNEGTMQGRGAHAAGKACLLGRGGECPFGTHAARQRPQHGWRAPTHRCHPRCPPPAGPPPLQPLSLMRVLHVRAHHPSSLPPPASPSGGPRGPESLAPVQWQWQWRWTWQQAWTGWSRAFPLLQPNGQARGAVGTLPAVGLQSHTRSPHEATALLLWTLIFIAFT